MAREDYAIVLDFLPCGFPLDNKRTPLAIVIGEKGLVLLQIIPRRGEKFDINERIYIGDGKRDKVQYILGRCPREKLTDTTKLNLEDFIKKCVGEDEERFVKFFNKAQAINTRLHQLELLPGLGKKHTMAVLEAREEELFQSFDDIKQRVVNMPSPDKIITKRIMEELCDIQRHSLFVI
jgi:putative nucleotide binding protein